MKTKHEKNLESIKEQLGEEDSEEGSESKYNDALAQLQRIGILWDKCHHARSWGRLSNWNVHLDAVWLELISDVSTGDKKKVENVNKDYLKYKSNRKILYEVLMKKEETLRLIQNKQGKGSVTKDDDKGL